MAFWLCPACVGRHVGPAYVKDIFRQRPRGDVGACAAVCSPAHGDECPSHATCGSGSLCQRLSCSGARCAPGGFFQGAQGASLEGGVGFAFAFSPTAPPFCLRAFHASPRSRFSFLRRRGCHGHAGLPRSLPDRGALDSVRRMLGWGSPAFAGRIRASTTLLGDLAVG
jgi:hypothetical protein